MALALPRVGSFIKRRPLAPLAISRADGTSAAVKPPTQSRSPFGTLMSPVQQLRPGAVPSSTLLQGFQRRLPKPPAAGAAPQPAGAPAAPAAPAPAANPLSQLQTGGTRTEPTINGRPVGAPAPAPTAFQRVAAQQPVLQAPAAPPAAAPAAPVAPGRFAEETRDIQGTERPQAISPGQSATQPLQEQAQAAAARALENPSPFDDDLFKQEVGRAREAFGGDIAERGLDYSTIAPTLFAERVLNPMLSERARGIAEARRSALAGAQDVIGQRTGLEAQGRGELRGERGYVDQLREQARRNEIERYQLGESQFQTTLQQALASGDPSRALAALQSAAYGMGGPAAQYGAQAEATGGGLQDLAELFLNQFYGNQGGK